MRVHHARVGFIAQLDHGNVHPLLGEGFHHTDNPAGHGILSLVKGQVSPHPGGDLLAGVGPGVAEVEVDQDVHAGLLHPLRFLDHTGQGIVQPLRIVPQTVSGEVHSLVRHPLGDILDGGACGVLVDVVHGLDARQEGEVASPPLGARNKSCEQETHQREPFGHAGKVREPWGLTCSVLSELNKKAPGAESRGLLNLRGGPIRILRLRARTKRQWLLRRWP